jgi:hypothetical protein
MSNAATHPGQLLKSSLYINLIFRNGITTSLNGGIETMTTNLQEILIETLVTYVLNLNGRVILIENVPARVNQETGEQFFSVLTVERLHQAILDREEPDHFIQVPVYNYLKAA